MEGITILNKISHPVWGTGWNWVCWFMIALIAIDVLVIIRCHIYHNQNEVFAFIIILPILLAIFALAFFQGKQIGETYTYEITIDGTTNMEEFVDKYVIVSQRGAIFEVRLKEDDS